MATTSVGTTVTLTPQGGSAISATEIRSVSVASDSQSLVDAAGLGTEFKELIPGQVENPVITVVTLDKPNWTRSAAKGTLVVQFGPGGSGNPSAVSFYNCVLSEVSASVGIDAAVEFTFVFTSLQNTDGSSGGGISP